MPAVTVYPIDDHLAGGLAGWLATMGGGDGFCATGRSISGALRALADELDRVAIAQSQAWLVGEANARSCPPRRD